MSMIPIAKIPLKKLQLRAGDCSFSHSSTNPKTLKSELPDFCKKSNCDGRKENPFVKACERYLPMLEVDIEKDKKQEPEGI